MITKVRTVVTNAKNMLQALYTNNKVVAAVRAAAAVAAVLGVACCAHAHHEQLGKVTSPMFRKLCADSVWAFNEVMVAIRHGMKGLEDSTGLTREQVCTCIHRIILQFGIQFDAPCYACACIHALP
jgi:hypothetical protein